jgi:GNAT superfamily N-acetyltransferase
MEHTIRPVRAEDWQQTRELRLAALQDPIAHLAFLDTYERARAQPDAHWQRRAADAAEGRVSRQFVAQAADGRWLGTVSVLVERAGVETFFGDVPTVEQAHVVGVFVRPEARGTGVAQALLRAAEEWAWGLVHRVERVRLFVHEDNHRAEAMYLKAGFVPSGHTVPAAHDAARVERELVLTRPPGR